MDINIEKRRNNILKYNISKPLDRSMDYFERTRYIIKRFPNVVEMISSEVRCAE